MGYNPDDWSYPIPVQFIEVMEMLWIKAFGSNRYKAWEMFACGGIMSEKLLNTTN